MQLQPPSVSYSSLLLRLRNPAGWGRGKEINKRGKRRSDIAADELREAVGKVVQQSSEIQTVTCGFCLQLQRSPGSALRPSAHAAIPWAELSRPTPTRFPARVPSQPNPAAFGTAR